MVKKKRLIVISVILLMGLAWLLWGNLTVGLTEVTVIEDNLPLSFHGFRIAHVSDLHNSQLWKQTIKQLQNAKPDIICITGDLIDGNRTNIDLALTFVSEAVKIAPCYYVTGNHELALDSADRKKLMEGLEDLGVTVLNNEAVLVEMGDEQIRIAGVGWGSSQYQGKLSEYDGYTVLLAHDPKHFESYADAGYALVLCGHVHGGQARLPFVGGLYGPGQGILPEYDSGVYSDRNTDMVVSRGIGNSIIPVRFHNRPEVILITLKQA